MGWVVTKDGRGWGRLALEVVWLEFEIDFLTILMGFQDVLDDEVGETR